MDSMIMTRRARGRLGGTAVTGHDDIANLPRHPRASARMRRTVKHRERQQVRAEVRELIGAGGPQ